MNILQKLNNLANLYEKKGEYTISKDIHKLFIKIAQSKSPELARYLGPSIVSTDNSFTKLAKKTPEQLLAEIYETAEKVNKLDDSKGDGKLESLIEEMMGHDKDLPTMELNPVNHEDMTIEAESNLEDAINNFDSNLYKVDPHGDWKGSEWMKIDEYIEMLIDKYGDNILDAPAAIDANHIAFDSPDGFQVINMVHKSNWNHGN